MVRDLLLKKKKSEFMEIAHLFWTLTVKSIFNDNAWHSVFHVGIITTAALEAEG